MRRFVLMVLVGWPAMGHPQDPYPVDWEAIAEEALTHFAALLRTDTTNPPATRPLWRCICSAFCRPTA